MHLKNGIPMEVPSLDLDVSLDRGKAGKSAVLVNIEKHDDENQPFSRP